MGTKIKITLVQWKSNQIDFSDFFTELLFLLPYARIRKWYYEYQELSYILIKIIKLKI